MSLIKFVITKKNSFIGKSYLCDGLFVLNIVNSPLVKCDLSSSSVSNIDLSYVWHGGLGHVNLKTIECMMNLDLISEFEINCKA